MHACAPENIQVRVEERPILPFFFFRNTFLMLLIQQISPGNLYVIVEKITWIQVNSIGKIFYSQIRYLRFNSHLLQKPFGVSLMIKINFQEQTP